MATIHQLSAKTSHSLSMGQVVTSVFSVVKELLENALDAGATSIDVRLDDFGLDKIEVRDNGSGLTPENTAVMGQAHYTSKIQHFDDMGSLSSFGFRGEALSAVCASCEVTVATRTASEQAGRLVTLDASGAITAQRPVARGQGTTVTASSLFSRQPVRRQLYSSARKRRDDLRAVEALLAATAVSRPPLRLALHHNASQLLNKAPCDSAKSAAVQVLKSEAARLLQPLTLTDEPISVEALLPAPDAPPKIAGRSTADQCYVIVNGRVIRYKRVEKLLRDQFSARHGLSTLRVPVSVVHITVPPSQLDVNLEPNKTRLMLICEEKLLTLLESGLAEFYRAAVTTGPAEPPVSADHSVGAAAAEAEAEAEGTPEPAEPAVSSDQSVGAAAAEAEGTEPAPESASDVVSDTSTEPTTASPVPAALTSVPAALTSVPVVTSGVTGDAAALPGVTFDEAARHNPAAAMTGVTDVTRPVTGWTDPVTKPDGVPKMADIEWDASPESLFGENFLGVAMDGGEGEVGPPPAAGDRHSSPSDSPDQGPAGRGTESDPGGRSDPWATGRLLDSQGGVIEPTKLVTSYGEPAAKRPKIQPSIRAAFGSMPSANGHTGSGPDLSSGGTGAATAERPAAGGGGGGGGSGAVRGGGGGVERGVGGGGAGSTAPAPWPEDPLPAKRPRPIEPGEPEYEPVASQVVRRAGTAFHYYCRDMRRKYLSLDPTIDIGKLSAALADGWKAALPSVRRQFEGMAREDDSRYREDVRKAKLAELIRTPQRTITDFCRVDTELRRMVAPLTPEARARRPRRRSQKLSLSGLQEELRRAETAGRGGSYDNCSEPRVIGPLESHQAWVVLRSSELLLVNPLRLSETCTLTRLLANYRFPCQPLSPPLPLTSASLGAAAHSTLCRLPRDGSSVADARLEASGFCVEVVGEVARLVALTDCMACYGAGDLAELLHKVAAGAETLAGSRPARVVSWLQAEAVRISQGGGARMSAEEVAALIHDADDLASECFHGRPMAAPLYELVT